MEPDFDFRSTFSYNNLMVAAGGHLLELVTGKTWEFLVSELFQALEMQSSVTDTIAAIETGNYAVSTYLVMILLIIFSVS
jgi:hypothetical protein